MEAEPLANDAQPLESSSPIVDVVDGDQAELEPPTKRQKLDEDTKPEPGMNLLP